MKITHATIVHLTLLSELPVSPLLIRAATPDDQSILLDWNAAMAWETEKKQLDPAVL